MAVRVPEIIEDVKSYTIYALALIAAWLLLVPTFTGYREDQLLANHLAAYLSIRDGLSAHAATVFFDVENLGWEPARPSGYVFGVTGKTSVFRCDVQVHREAGTVTRPGTYDSECRTILISSLEKRSRPLSLQFRRIAVPTNSEGIVAYFSIDAPDANLPLSAYRLVLGRRSSVIPGVFSQRPAIPEVPDALAPVQEARKSFLNNYDAFLVNASLAETFLEGVGGEDATLADSLARAAYGTKTAYVQAREPMGWSRTSELLRDESGKIPKLTELTLGTSGVKKLVQQYINEEDTYEVAGIKVTTSLVPWAIAVVLLMLSCLLVGKYSSLSRVTSRDVADDFGWLFLQVSRRPSALIIVASALVILLTAAIVAVAIVVTLDALLILGGPSRFPLAALLLTMIVFACVSSLIVYRQISISLLSARHGPAPSASDGLDDA